MAKQSNAKKAPPKTRSDGKLQRRPSAVPLSHLVIDDNHEPADAEGKKEIIPHLADMIDIRARENQVFLLLQYNTTADSWTVRGKGAR